MYLKRAYIRNNGPIAKLNIELPFDADSRPNPMVLVGPNGSGKTNLLSIIADAMFEAAAAHYEDAVERSQGVLRPWFRVAGGRTISVSAAGTCTVLQFQHEEKDYFFREQAGSLTEDDFPEDLTIALGPAADWNAKGTKKEFGINDAEAQAIFENGSYLYFPSNRAEAPHWLNRESLKREQFDLSPRRANRLRKQIYVDHGLEDFEQWLLSVLIDARLDFNLGSTGDGLVSIAKPVGDIEFAAQNSKILHDVTQILKIVTQNEHARFSWGGCKLEGRISVISEGKTIAPSLESLSAGQATLLSTFGKIMRYGDMPTNSYRASEVEGICIIDEIDSHLHVDLQYQSLPRLMSIFPNIQFIVSSHSPLFVLGMEQEFGDEGFRIIDMLSGMPIQAEAYSEFDSAFKILRETRTFNEAVVQATGSVGKTLVFLEGETDPKYLQAAAEVLGREEILEKFELDWRERSYFRPGISLRKERLR